VTGIAVERQFATSLPKLPPEVELAIYRIAQESLTNVARHAQARQVVIALEPHAWWVSPMLAGHEEAPDLTQDADAAVRAFVAETVGEEHDVETAAVQGQQASAAPHRRSKGCRLARRRLARRRRIQQSPSRFGQPAMRTPCTVPSGHRATDLRRQRRTKMTRSLAAADRRHRGDRPRLAGRPRRSRPAAYWGASLNATSSR